MCVHACVCVRVWLCSAHRTGGGETPVLLTKGVIQGICSMRGDGEVARFIIAPEYAFGADGCSEFEIPGDATLTYEINLIGFQNVSQK